MVKEPMLAAKLTPQLIEKLPLHDYLLSAKLDGIRAFVSNGKTFSRKLKLIPNGHVQEILSDPLFHGLDGELIVGEPYAMDVYRQTSSGVMSRGGTPSFRFYVFDDYTMAPAAFLARYNRLRDRVADLEMRGFPVVLVRQYPITVQAELYQFEDRCLERGYEGIMVRHRHASYKEGRSTAREGGLFKFKRFVDDEAEIIGVKEKLHNDNPAEVNELGRTKRSGHKENKRPAGTLGGLILRTRGGVEFNAPMGKGWDDAAKAHLWSIRETLPGKWVTYESLPIGVKDRPRHPKVKGFRDITVD